MPPEIVRLFGDDEAVAYDKIKTMFEVLLAGGTYSRDEWWKRRDLISQGVWRDFSEWMRDERYARYKPSGQNGQTITASGLAMMRSVGDAIKQWTP